MQLSWPPPRPVRETRTLTRDENVEHRGELVAPVDTWSVRSLWVDHVPSLHFGVGFSLHRGVRSTTTNRAISSEDLGYCIALHGYSVRASRWTIGAEQFLPSFVIRSLWCASQLSLVPLWPQGHVVLSPIMRLSRPSTKLPRPQASGSTALRAIPARVRFASRNVYTRSGLPV